MVLYVAVAVWPIIMGILFKYYKKRVIPTVTAKNIHILLALIPMFVLIALRDSNIGADTSVYLKYFNLSIDMTIPEMIDKFRFEEGFLIFTNFISSFVTKNALVYQIIYTLIYLFGVWSFACELEEDDAFLFSFFFASLGIFTFMFTGVRQCLAISICLVSYRFVKQRKLIPFLLLIALAFTFHKSSVLFIAVYILNGRKLTLPNIAIYGVCTYLATNYLFEIQEWFNEALDYDYAIEQTGSGGIFLIILALLTAFSFIMLWDAKLLDTSCGKAFMNINFIALLLWILRIQTRVAERPSFYFLFFSCALFAYTLNRVKDRQIYFLAKIAIVILCLLLYVYRFSTNFASFVPYKLY